MLKMSLNEIRGNIQLYPENWVNLSTTNCYAYALGLDINENDICKSAYQPGNISGICDLNVVPEYFLYSKLIKNLNSDLTKLNILYREINPNDQIDTDEWKIALFVEIYERDIIDDLVSDFHFLRSSKNGFWSHKNGFFGSPTKKDYSDQIITDPRKCDLCLYEYKKCYALSLKK